MAISSAAKSGISTFAKYQKASAGTTIPSQQFLATGPTGAVLTSPDGITWTSRTTGLPGYALVAPHKLGSYYIVYDSGYKNRYISSDGITWTKSGQMTGFMPTSSQMNYTNAKRDPIDGTINLFPNMAYQTGNFGSMFDATNGVAVGDLSVTSTSFAPWDYATNGSVYLIAGSGGTTYLLKSTTAKNGPLAAQAYGASTGTFGVAYGAGIFAVSAENGTGIYTSTDGSTWTSRGQSNRYLQYLNTLFFNYNGNAISRSSDAISWTSTTVTGLGANGIHQMAYGAGVYVMVCDSGAIFSSSDGITWTSRTSGTATTLTNVYYG